jgi:hypothetical protein
VTPMAFPPEPIFTETILFILNIVLLAPMESSCSTPMEWTSKLTTLWEA